MNDEALRQFAMGGVRLRLRIGEALEALACTGGHHELGFSSLSAYALERCHRGARWARETRAVARRISATLREALVSGRISWSMAELLVRHATAGNEAALLEAAVGRTVKEMRAFLGGKEPAELASLRIECGAEELVVFEAARMLVRAIDGKRPTDDELMVSLLAEGESTLGIASMPVGRIRFDVGGEVEPVGRDQDGRAGRDDDGIVGRDDEGPPRRDDEGASGREAGLPSSATGLDAEIRRLCAELERRDLEVGRLAEELIASRGWVRLGYRSLAAYAEGRLGMSVSSLRHRVTLARRCEGLPEIGAALRRGEIGYEAPMLLTRIATPDNAEAWVERARGRTFKHLREDVDAVEFLLKVDPTAGFDPPSDAVLAAYFEFERGVLRGDVMAPALEGKPATLPISVIAGHRKEIRLRLSEETIEDYSRIEDNFYAVFPPEASFVGFLLASLWQTWLPIVQEQRRHKWSEVYERDRWRCSNPTCTRSDVTPHHLLPKGRGGGDETENMGALCYWCHLLGVHEGRIQAEPPGSRIRWTLGREPIMRVEGRERAPAASRVLRPGDLDGIDAVSGERGRRPGTPSGLSSATTG